MNADFPVVIDANVLMQAAIRDTLLRLSEQRLFLCRWSEDILAEVRRNLIGKFDLKSENVDYLLSEMRTHFPDACVDGYKSLIPSMTNDEKDRHIVAAAVKCNAEVIITYNTKHFPESSIKPLNICTKTPDEYLIDLYQIDPQIVVHTLHQQGQQLAPTKTIDWVLDSLKGCRCTEFSQLIRERLSL